MLCYCAVFTKAEDTEDVPALVYMQCTMTISRGEILYIVVLNKKKKFSQDRTSLREKNVLRCKESFMKPKVSSGNLVVNRRGVLPVPM